MINSGLLAFVFQHKPEAKTVLTDFTVEEWELVYKLMLNTHKNHNIRIDMTVDEMSRAIEGFIFHIFSRFMSVINNFSDRQFLIRDFKRNNDDLEAWNAVLTDDRYSELLAEFESYSDIIYNVIKSEELKRLSKGYRAFLSKKVINNASAEEVVNSEVLVNTFKQLVVEALILAHPELGEQTKEFKGINSDSPEPKAYFIFHRFADLVF